MPTLLSRTSLTLDEAIAYLMGLIDGPVNFTAQNPCSIEHEDEAEQLLFDLNEQLNDDYEDAVSALAEAKLQRSAYPIQEAREAQILKATNNIQHANQLRCLIQDELLKPAPRLRIDPKASNPHTPYISIASIQQWAKDDPRVGQIKDLLEKNKDADRASKSEPWWVPHEGDPEPEQDWYIPARYFARQLINADPSLNEKRLNLAQHVAEKLTEHKINKRGGIKPLAESTIGKSFVNVKF